MSSFHAGLTTGFIGSSVAEGTGGVVAVGAGVVVLVGGGGGLLEGLVPGLEGLLSE